MALITKAIKGTSDILPKDSYKINFLEDIIEKEVALYGFKEIRTPVFEHTELFLRSVGETTDVVQKEMYTFNDKGGRSITLRPEGTAGAVRAMVEHSAYNDGLPLKAYYFTSCYRYEKPQAGRYREFHQFGLEVFGAANPVADAELISVADAIFERIGLKNISLQINSIGCPECRKKYNQAIKEYFESRKSELCDTCIGRLERNPMRILDCKNPDCKKISDNAPIILDYLCDECREHFEKVKAYLDTINIKYTVNPKMVRGLDYYTRTVFEFVSDDIGAQGSVCGGGRYDGLVKEIGGPDMPSLGFGIGMERLMLLVENQKVDIPTPETCDLYIAPIGKKAELKAFELLREIRQTGLICETDLVGKSIKAQMKYANKIGAKFSVVIGDEEIEKGFALVKDMDSSETSEISLGENFSAEFFALHIEKTLGSRNLNKVFNID